MAKGNGKNGNGHSGDGASGSNGANGVKGGRGVASPKEEPTWSVAEPAASSPVIVVPPRSFRAGAAEAGVKAAKKPREEAARLGKMLITRAAITGAAAVLLYVYSRRPERSDIEHNQFQSHQQGDNKF